MDLQAEIVVANRPYADPDGADAPGQAEGGLLVALRDVIAPWAGTSGTTWIGGQRVEAETAPASDYDYVQVSGGVVRQRLVALSERTWSGHYAAASNSFLWPLLHLINRRLPELAEYYPAPTVPTGDEWASYSAANEAFADAVMDAGQHDCWVHDYQLALVPRMLRERGFRGRIGFFLHTPFPRIDLALDYAPGAGRDYLAEFAEGILHADLAGFQTVADQERFEATLRQLNLRKGPLARHATTAIPVGVDSQPDHEPMDDEAAGLVHESEHLPLVVGLERFDFTKGIPERLRSVARVIQRGARFRYLGIAAPTRQGVQVYEGLRAAVDDAADEARQAAERARLPFLQSQRALSHGAVSTLLREADIIFTSSFADGMNLVPLQGIVAQTGAASHNRGVVIAGRDTGAYRTYERYAGDGLRGVDPLSWDDMDEALLAAIEGRLPAVTDRLGRAVRDNDARHWAQRFLTELQAAWR